MRKIAPWMVAVASAAVTPASGRGAVEMPHPRALRPPSFDAATANAACEGCHADVAREWRSSLHRNAATDPAYVRAFAIEPLRFCSDCHAPEGAAHRAIGVGCVTCHVTDGATLAAPNASARASPHPVMRDARFTSPAACAGCHEFRFPNAPSGSALPGDFMQSTVTEHARSGASDRSCASCHMPAVAGARGGRRSHAFSASRDEPVVRGAVAVVAARISTSRVRIALTPRDVGHAFPTGDLFRRLAVSAEARDTNGTLRSRDVVYLSRHTQQHGAGSGRAVDDRVGLDARFDPDRAVVLDLEGACDTDAVTWRVVYQRVERPTSTREEDALVDGEIVVASGTLDPHPKGTRCDR